MSTASKTEHGTASEPPVHGASAGPMIGIGAAFASLGFLVGLLTGMTASAVVGSLLGLIFAFVGGSVIALLSKVDERQQLLAYKAIFALSTGAIVGLLGGILLSEWQLLGPRRAAGDGDTSIMARKYLRENVIPEANRIDQQKRQGLITADDAYEQLRHLLAPRENK